MSVPRTQASVLARLCTDAGTARRLLDALGEAFASSEAAVATFEEAGAWTVEIYFEGAPDKDAVRALVGDLAGDAASEGLTFTAVAAGDWIAQSLAGLAPVGARRFVIHGAHDRHRIAPNRIGVEIEAALAFGTGHHGTTQGCLFALDRILDRRRPRRILDVGCGTGVLAIAAARATRRPVVAGDIDPVSVGVARGNARLNRVGALVKVIQGNGLADRRMRAGAPFDLVFANILLDPVKQLARPVRRLVAPGGRVVISGLLAGQAKAALAAYRACGLVLERRILLDGWMTLVLTRPATRIVGDGRVGKAIRPSAAAYPVPHAEDGREGQALPARRRRTRIVRPRQMTLDAIMSENTVKTFHAQFQTFDDPAETSDTASRLAALRAELARRGLDGFVVPHADRHQNEYLPPSEERLAWITGFTGSAGAALILADRAVLFVDGRYTLQAPDQVDPKLFAIEHLVDKPPSAWIESNLKAGQKLGFDPWLHTADGAERLAKACSAVGAILVATEPNPIDAACRNRVAPPHGAIVPHDLKFAGEPAPKKLERIRAEIAKLNADALVVSDAHAVAWTFNIRGADVSHTPLPLAFAIILADGARLYVEESKLTDAARTALAGLADVRSEDTFAQDLAALGAEHLVVRIDQSTAAHAISQAITANGGKVLRGPDPIAVMKAVKNDAEIAGSSAAHRRDGAAVINFLAWFDRAAGGGDLTEIDAVEALETFRRDTGFLREVSFPTISGAGPNGAIVHYRVTRKTNRKIVPGELFLIDSGAQYEDGTTDITRTVIVGDPSPEMRDRFTRVLKGHIAIARAVFPDGTSGSQLDSFARTHLWAAGLDFDHGTGHGVGSYLSVHEGPARIAKLGTEALRRGMILSNEPGYYKAGHYGIRIENLVLVAEAPAVAGGEKPLNRFETLTLAPIDQRLIDRQLMTADEIHWLDAYHAEVRETLMPRVAADTQEWLAVATAPLGRG